MVYKTERNELVTSYETEQLAVATVAILSRLSALATHERERERGGGGEERFRTGENPGGGGEKTTTRHSKGRKKDGMSLNEGAYHGANHSGK